MSSKSVLFRDLKKLVGEQHTDGQSKQFASLRGLPFWIWNIDEHRSEYAKTDGFCCMQHVIGLPEKDGIPKPMFDYEKTLYEALMINESHNPLNHAFKHKHLWVLKSTGLGVTEFFLRVMAWLALRNDDYRNSQMVIVTGPNQDIAIKLIRRMKALFEPKLGITFDSKETALTLNGCDIQAYPSNHTDSFRALANPKFLLIDEGDYFRLSEQSEVRAVSERYIAKSDPYIAFVSTPNAPGQLFESIQKEPAETCLYKRLFLDYSYGVGKIYTAEEIEKPCNRLHLNENTTSNI